LFDIWVMKYLFIQIFYIVYILSENMQNHDFDETMAVISASNFSSADVFCQLSEVWAHS